MGNPGKTIIGKDKKVLLWIILVAVVVRLVCINSLLLDCHSFRQAITAMTSRNICRGDGNLFMPLRDDGGAKRIIANGEFPVYQYTVAVFYKIFGVHEIIGRLVNVFFSVLSIFFLYLLVKNILDRKLALLTAGVYSLVPLAVYYSRTFQRFGMVICFLIGGLYFFNKWVNKPKWYFSILAVIFCNISFLMYPPGMSVILPMAYLAYSKYGKKAFKDYRLYLTFFCLVIFTFAWIYYFVKISGGGAFAWHHDWGNWKYYFTWLNINYFFKTMFYVPAKFVFTPLGYAALIIGIIKSSEKKYRMFYFWMLAIYINYALDPYPSFQVLHEYYYYQLVPAGAVFIAVGLDWLWQRRRLLQVASFKRVMVILVLIICSVSSMYPCKKAMMRYVTRWRINQYLPSLTVRGITEKDSLVVYAGGKPQLVYYCDRIGWKTSKYPGCRGSRGHAAIERYKRKGADYLVNLTTGDFKEKHKKYLLDLQEHYKLIERTNDYVIYKLI